MKHSLSNEELLRYGRHLNLPGFGVDSQEKLKGASVLVVGAGGLGAPLLQYLVAAGIGKIGIVDHDRVDASNLQRQVLYGTEDIGKLKVEVASRKLNGLNPNVEIETYPVSLTSENALEIIDNYEIVADGTDNFPTRYLVNDACVLACKTNVYASIFQFEGQISVFNYLSGDTRGPNYRDLFPTPPDPGSVPNCAEGGVLGVLPGILGSFQALEVLKVITGLGEPLVGKLMIIDTLYHTQRVLKFKKDPDNPLTGSNPQIKQLIDYEHFCGLSVTSTDSITVEELMNWRKNEIPHVLIDVREPHEYEVSNLGGLLIPKSIFIDQVSQFPKEGKVVVHCKSGGRSGQVISYLEKEFGYTNLINLEGGIDRWIESFDKTVSVNL